MARLPDLGPRGEGWVLVQLVLLAGIGLAGLVSIQGADWLRGTRLGAAVLGSLAIAVGTLVVIRSILDLRASLSPFPRPTEANQLVVAGAFRYVRHPIYAGLILASLGWGVLTGSLLAIALALLLLVWFDLKARREETWLAARHPGYAAYRARTRKFVPFVY